MARDHNQTANRSGVICIHASVGLEGSRAIKDIKSDIDIRYFVRLRRTAMVKNYFAAQFETTEP